MSFIKNNLFFFLNRQQKKEFIILVAGVMSNGVLEMFSLAAVIPFLGVAANPNLIEQNEYLILVYNLFSFASHKEFLIFLGSGLILLLFFASCSTALFTWFSLRFTWAVNNSLAVRLIEHYMRLDYLQFIQRNSADLQKNIQTEVAIVTSDVINPLLNLVNKAFSICLTIILLLIIDPFLVLFMGLMFGLVYYAIYFFAKKTFSRIGIGSLQDNEIKFKSANEAFGVFKIAKLLHLESYFINRFAKASLSFTRNNTKRMTIAQLPRFAVEAIAFSIMIGISLYMIITKPNFAAAIPALGLYVFAAYRLLPGIQQIYTNFSVIRSSWPHVSYLQKELESSINSETLGDKELESEKIQPPSANPVPIIEFRNVSFSYPTTKVTTIDNVSFSITEKTSVGFMGETGSGKTTLIDLILGIISPDKGTILVYGTPLNYRNIESWQKSIGYVPQDIYLTDNTIAENIAFGIPKDEINMDRVQKAAGYANIADFIDNDLIGKYETIVGERGVRLSGGQRQRIGIARALYYEPRFIVFDEATSSLDNETEESVMEAIENFSHEKTIIIIAHRLTTLQKCDLVIKVDKGQLVKSGNFTELVEQRAVQNSIPKNKQ